MSMVDMCFGQGNHSTLIVPISFNGLPAVSGATAVAMKVMTASAIR
jgi:hypothetical protein